MSFKLEVAKFCDGCGYFDADVMRFKKCENVRDVETDHIHKYTDTYISCKHLAHCKKMRGEEVDRMIDNTNAVINEHVSLSEDEISKILTKLSEKFGLELDLVNTELSKQEASIHQQMLDLEFNKEDSENE